MRPSSATNPRRTRAAAPLPDVATALRTLAARVPQAVPTYIIVHDPGTRGQHVQIIAEHPRRLIYGETYAFDGAGNWRGANGMADGAIGKQFAASTYNLHFGNYAGLPVEIAYMLMGLALCVVTATGTTLWLCKRQRRGLGGERLSACWSWIVWGTPLLLVATVWLRAAAGPIRPARPGILDAARARHRRRGGVAEASGSRAAAADRRGVGARDRRHPPRATRRRRGGRRHRRRRRRALARVARLGRARAAQKPSGIVTGPTTCRYCVTA